MSVERKSLQTSRFMYLQSARRYRSIDPSGTVPVVEFGGWDDGVEPRTQNPRKLMSCARKVLSGRYEVSSSLMGAFTAQVLVLEAG